MTGCPYGAGAQCRDCDGGCWDMGADEPSPPEPTIEEYCAGRGHEPYADNPDDGMTYCYCGTKAVPTPPPEEG